jgi:acetyl-CoA synthetase
VVCAGEVLNPDVWNWLYKDVFDHMWQTEVPGAIFGYPVGDAKSIFKPGSAGLPMPGVVPEILDEHTGQKSKPMQKGILALKNPVPGMTPSLWMDPERYQREYWETNSFTKGMYYTGDAAYVDREGYVFFVGRADEVIKISGHRIGTIEIESTIVSHPAIAEAAVVGVSDELRGEVALGFVTLRPGYSPLDSLRQELIDHVRRTIGPLIVFKTIEFVEIIPKTRSGKIMPQSMR